MAPYSLRGWEVPTVSMPVGWDEVEAAATSGDAHSLIFVADDALRRAKANDPFAPVATLTQRLPTTAPFS